jgi:hypothetical protein
MTLADILGGCGLIIVLLSLIQIVPIRINPWTWFARKIGKAVNGELLEKVAVLEKHLTELKAECAMNAALTKRERILAFGDEMLHGQHHSKERFDHILADIAAYEHYCNTHPDFVNGVAPQTIKQINKMYQERFQKRDFI